MSYKDFLTTKWFVGTDEEQFDDEEDANDDEMDDYDDGITPESYQSVILDSGVEFPYENEDDGLVELNEKSSLLNKVQSLAHRTATLDIRIYMLVAVIIMMIMGGMSYNSRRTSVARVKKAIVPTVNPPVIIPFDTTEAPTDTPTRSPTIFTGATAKPIANIKPKPSATQSTVAPSQTASPSTSGPTPKATMKPQLLPGQTFAPTPIPTVPPTPAEPSESPTDAPVESPPPSVTPTAGPSPIPSPQPSEKPNYATMYPSAKPHTGTYHTLPLSLLHATLMFIPCTITLL